MFGPRGLLLLLLGASAWWPRAALGLSITCPDISTGNDLNQCGAIAYYQPVVVGGIFVGCGIPSGTFFPVGKTSVTCTAAKLSLPPAVASCSFDVTVSDSQPPYLTCPPNITKSNDPNQCGAVATYGAPSASDNCPGTSTITCSPASGSFFPVGTTTITCATSDTVGNYSACSFSVKINDVQPPTVTCPADVTKANDPDRCGAVASYTGTASDNCPGVVLSCAPASGAFFPQGDTQAECQANDPTGNSSTCSFEVTIDDTQPPVITCPPDVTASLPAGASVLAFAYQLAANDNCPGLMVMADPPTGSLFPLGPTSVTATAKDLAGGRAMCSFVVTVTASAAPSAGTTTTTLPSACVRAATFASVACRLDALTPVLRGALVAQEPVGDRLLAALDKTRTLLGSAESLRAAGRERGARSALRKAAKALGKFRRLLGSRAGHALVPEGVRASLVASAAQLVEDLRILRRVAT